MIDPSLTSNANSFKERRRGSISNKQDAKCKKKRGSIFRKNNSKDGSKISQELMSDFNNLILGNCVPVSTSKISHTFSTKNKPSDSGGGSKLNGGNPPDSDRNALTAKEDDISIAA